jgi:FkbM family methyltransferase
MLFKKVIERIAFWPIWLLNRPQFSKLNRAAYDFALCINGLAIGWEGQFVNYNEERFLRRHKAELNGRIIFDVGANIGTYTKATLSICPAAKIFAFEPHPVTFQRLCQNVGADATVLNVALGDQCGVTTLYDFADQPFSTAASLNQGVVSLPERGVVEHRVEVTTVDEVCKLRQIDHIALLKLDTEGTELKVLRGATRMLAENRIGMIQFEFMWANVLTRVFMKDFFDALSGWRIYRLALNGKLLPLFPYSFKYCEIFVMSNCVALPPIAST